MAEILEEERRAREAREAELAAEARQGGGGGGPRQEEVGDEQARAAGGGRRGVRGDGPAVCGAAEKQLKASRSSALSRRSCARSPEEEEGKEEGLMRCPPPKGGRGRTRDPRAGARGA